MTTYRSYKDFSDFYNNQFIQDIARNPKWTVSDKKKMPIDMFSFKTFGKISGALFTNELSLVTLDELNRILPNAKNNAYYLDALTDKYVVLDIEPICPDELKNELLQTPYIYGEKSMSGKGYHLVFRLPECIAKYPDAQKKVAFKDENKYYEILMCHWVTFTRNMIPPSVCDNDNFERLFETLASQQKKSAQNRTFTEYDELSVFNEGEIIKLACMQPYGKKPSDFKKEKTGEADLSRYEFGYCCHLYHRIMRIINFNRIKKLHTYTTDEIIHLVYKCAVKMIPPRAKHNELRYDLPWLLFVANQSVYEIIKGETDDNNE